MARTDLKPKIIQERSDSHAGLVTSAAVDAAVGVIMENTDVSPVAAHVLLLDIVSIRLGQLDAHAAGDLLAAREGLLHIRAGGGGDAESLNNAALDALERLILAFEAHVATKTGAVN